MTAAEFRAAALQSGYGCAVTVDKYIKRSGKDSYTEDDYIELYRFHDHYMQAHNHSADTGRRRYMTGGTGAKTTKHYTNTAKDGR